LTGETLEAFLTRWLQSTRRESAHRRRPSTGASSGNTGSAWASRRPP